ncbi:hypothetical protein DASC09_064110 [Saccharomycopsis crataegensis]|uniref:Uncharacterized protein n=1 Tax=Saccharomycopsis crataegensis TaxID=43959 RepID=A0AAV5QVZ3_9ASCO|nr:hypothetical protein DASC09_064110 [Saccharomycopsis crataegensis]
MYQIKAKDVQGKGSWQKHQSTVSVGTTGSGSRSCRSSRSGRSGGRSGGSFSSRLSLSRSRRFAFRSRRFAFGSRSRSDSGGSTGGIGSGVSSRHFTVDSGSTRETSHKGAEVRGWESGGQGTEVSGGTVFVGNGHKGLDIGSWVGFNIREILSRVDSQVREQGAQGSWFNSSDRGDQGEESSGELHDEWLINYYVEKAG